MNLPTVNSINEINEELKRIAELVAAHPESSELPSEVKEALTRFSALVKLRWALRDFVATTTGTPLLEVTKQTEWTWPAPSPFAENAASSTSSIRRVRFE